jgi:hypothetical protein
MSFSEQDRRLVTAFIIGVAISPVMIALAWAWLARSNPPPCSVGELCFRGVGEALISGIVAALVAGAVAGLLARDAAGWVAMMGGLLAAAVVLTSPGALLLGVPATIGYVVIAGLSKLLPDPPGQPAAAGSAGLPAGDVSRDRDDQCEFCGARLPPRARSCTTCGSAVLA